MSFNVVAPRRNNTKYYPVVVLPDECFSDVIPSNGKEDLFAPLLCACCSVVYS